VVDRLVEVLVIQLLRHAIAERLVDAGIMAGLSDARLAKAISALHDAPARAWTLEAMASVAGMSRARFAAHSAHTVSMPPGDYITGWRLGLARRLLRRGLAVKLVAVDAGCANPGAFGRVFLQRVADSRRQLLFADDLDQPQSSLSRGQPGDANTAGADGRPQEHATTLARRYPASERVADPNPPFTNLSDGAGTWRAIGRDSMELA
jgi:AraC-like DNA-binding protein